MRADSALSHLYDHEPCVAVMQDGSQRDVWWSREDWTFFFLHTEPPQPCSFDAIKEWRPASIRP